MNNKIYSLALAPLLFIACANTEPKQEEAPVAVAVKKVAPIVQENIVKVEEKVQTIIEPQTTQASVSFIENAKVLETGMMHIEAFMGSLQPTLKGLLASDSTHVVAMGGCSSMAIKMRDDYNRQITDVKIRRTALKYRNPKNKPDTTDRMVMDSFVTNNKLEPLVVDAGNHYRVYKPLPVKQSCLLCHGARNDISPELVKMIDRTYPKDMATGFQLGEFRGAVVAEVKK
jgi:hypothetical protein